MERTSADPQPRKTAVITGILGQDGAYLAEWLLRQNYRVLGWHRPGRAVDVWRLRCLGVAQRVELMPVALTDKESISRELQRIPVVDEFYHLGTRSTIDIQNGELLEIVQEDSLNTVRILDCLRKHCPQTRFLFASSAEIFGQAETAPQDELTAQRPSTAYGCCKMFGQNMTQLYRQSLGLFACSVILYNHESPLRDERFVTQKIVKGLLALRDKPDAVLTLGNLDAKRDWGCADEYVQGMWSVLQHERPEDFVLASGQATTVRSFAEICASEIGFELIWENSERGEVGRDRKSNRIIIQVSQDLKRPAEPPLRLGNAEKARRLLGWNVKKQVPDLIRWMLSGDY
ncbi:MAG: GDP-mannose 4,6-dehydratase [Candidatus Eremiobacteraeota bacterium]|nr:GDP-mannose 4,6-dehydratase [Candidatus Eremiobacteraeota bacterium]MCW5867194.1 GDP-mannose 4,6-dehydratase [Candidatus Eremiobacteraeota bacterium]